MSTAVLTTLPLLTLIHAGSPFYQKKIFFLKLPYGERSCKQHKTEAVSSPQEALASQCSPQKSLVVTGRTHRLCTELVGVL